MTTKNKEFTNEDVARELGHETRIGYSSEQELYRCLLWKSGEWAEDDVWDDCPDFMDDDNAANKHVWPELRKLLTGNDAMKDFSLPTLSELAIKALNSSNPALYLTNKFMEGKGWKPCKDG